MQSSASGILLSSSAKNELRLFSFSGKQLASVEASGLHNHMAAISANGRFFAAATFTSDVKVRLLCTGSISSRSGLNGDQHFCKTWYTVCPAVVPSCILKLYGCCIRAGSLLVTFCLTYTGGCDLAGFAMCVLQLLLRESY